MLAGAGTGSIAPLTRYLYLTYIPTGCWPSVAGAGFDRIQSKININTCMRVQSSFDFVFLHRPMYGFSNCKSHAISQEVQLSARTPSRDELLAKVNTLWLDNSLLLIPDGDVKTKSISCILEFVRNEIIFESRCRIYNIYANKD